MKHTSISRKPINFNIKVSSNNEFSQNNAIDNYFSWNSFTTGETSLISKENSSCLKSAYSPSKILVLLLILVLYL